MGIPGYRNMNKERKADLFWESQEAYLYPLNSFNVLLWWVQGKDKLGFLNQENYVLVLQLRIRSNRPYSEEISDVKQHDMLKEIIKTTNMGIVADITNWASIINMLNAINMLKVQHKYFILYFNSREGPLQVFENGMKYISVKPRKIRWHSE